MKIRIGIVSILSIILFSTGLIAQPPGGAGPEGRKEKSEKIKAMKVEFITSKLDLSSAEAEKFWPIYNEFMGKMDKIERGRRKSRKSNEGKELTDAEVNEMIKYNFDTDQELLDLRREYDAKFKNVLSIQKVGKLYLAEHQFRRELLRKMKGNGPPK